MVRLRLDDNLVGKFLFTLSIRKGELSGRGNAQIPINRRIADGYWRGAAVTKFPTKYICIELCVEGWAGNGEGPGPAPS